MLLLAVMSLATAETVGEAFPPPAGAQRIPGDAFGASLGELELADEGTPVRTHDGRTVRGHRARVVDLALVPGDLQQCADSVIRLRAEWLKARGEPVSFHATSGDPLPWTRYAAGERPYARGNAIHWKPGAAGSWEGYLKAVFTWAGTASLDAYETEATTELRPGHMLLDAGFPGHVVLLLDVAETGDETFVLIGEGFMPAQSFHVELGPHGGWWKWEDGIQLPHWKLPASTLRKWK